MRLAAEYENYRRRTGIDVAREREAAKVSVLVALTPALTALNAAAKADDLNPNLARVVTAIHDGFNEVGVHPVGAVGDEFNPNLHQAVAVAAGQDGVVLEVYQQGWANDTVTLLPAQVVVGNGEPPQ